MKRQALVWAMLIVTTIAAMGVFMEVHAPKSSQKAAVEKAEPKELDRLTIESIRNRTYTPSSLDVEQNLGNQGGYSNQIVSYTSDGLKIYALKSTPAGTAPAGGWPVIIFDHGYIYPPDYRTNDGSYQQFIAAFACAGYIVIKPDYRGHGQSQGVPEGGHFSPVYAYDNLNLIASLKQQPDVNAARIGQFGHSLGGHVALRTIVASKDVKATVLAAGVVGSFNDFFYNWPHSPMPYDRPQIVQSLKAQYVAKYGEPKANPNFWNSVTSLNYVNYISGAVQVDHDAGDSTVPALFSQHLVSALQKAGKTVEYNEYPGDDHQFSANRQRILADALTFYRKYL
ncbi:MAG TPA: alpha/beta fold hydrolase [Candidatus Saccharimonadales bacterium]|nr:alpha/beta fold hydrolase [Candidatus Saccharimonadales bacterium]